MEILLDGNVILNKETLFRTLKVQINSVDFIGNNLDALWDVLSTDVTKLEIKIINQTKLENHLGDYFNKVMNLFNDLSDSNKDVTFTID